MAWPRVQGVPTRLSNFLASVISNVSTEVGAVVIVLIVNLLLLRFFPRGRYPHRARLDGAGASYSELVGRMFHPSHRAFPHVVYWVSAGLFAFLAPEPTAKVWDTFGLFVTATWPSLYALYLAMRLRSEDVPDSADTPGARRTLQRQELTTSPSSADHDHPVHSASVVSPQVDRVLTYWIVFAVVMCCSYVPLASSVAEKVATLSFVGPAAFFLVLWVHLLGPESGLQVTSGSLVFYSDLPRKLSQLHTCARWLETWLHSNKSPHPLLQVVYDSLEPLVRTHVQHVRLPGWLSHTGRLQRLQGRLVFVGLLTRDNAKVTYFFCTNRCCCSPNRGRHHLSETA